MTRLALIADAHVANHKRWGGTAIGGVNQRGWECVEVLRKASEAARQHGCAGLVVLGDLFDHTRPTPPLVAATIQALKSGGVPVQIILGNHDRQSMHDLDQACASMMDVTGIKVVTEPTLHRYSVNTEVALIPYDAREAKDWLTSGLAAVAPQFTPGATRRVALTHLGIWDEDTPPYMKSAKDAVGIGHVRWLCDAHRIEFFAAGNWHDQRCWRPREGHAKDPVVLIPGTVCPHNFSDPQEHGAVVIWDATNNSWTNVSLAGPLFLKVDTDKEASLLVRTLRNHYSARDPGRAYIRLTARTDQVSDALELKAMIAKDYPTAVVHIETSEVEAKASAREAARAAVRAGESEQSLLDYAELASVDEPGTREGVVRRLGEYRKAAG